jgi:hypothetical protein
MAFIDGDLTWPELGFQELDGKKRDRDVAC